MPHECDSLGRGMDSMPQILDTVVKLDPAKRATLQRKGGGLRPGMGRAIGSGNAAPQSEFL
jgi:hypothetical protein